MAWDDTPPTAQEIKGAPAWDAAPPTKEELAGKSEPSWLDKSVPVVGGTPRGYIQGGLNVLPTAGAFGGGVLGGTAGAAAGPAGALAAGAGGAALGGATGEGLKKLGEHYILGQEQAPGDYVSAEGKGLLHGAEQEMGGQVLSKGAGMLKEVPDQILDVATRPAIASSSSEAKEVYDPFLKTWRVPGKTLSEMEPLNANLSKESTSEVAPKDLKQMMAEKAANAIESTGSLLKKGADFAGKVVPNVMEYMGAHLGGGPGLIAAKALASDTAKAIGKAGAVIMKDAAGNFVATPEGMGLITRGGLNMSSHNPEASSK